MGLFFVFLRVTILSPLLFLILQMPYLQAQYYDEYYDDCIDQLQEQYFNDYTQPSDYNFYAGVDIEYFGMHIPKFSYGQTAIPTTLLTAPQVMDFKPFVAHDSPASALAKIILGTEITNDYCGSNLNIEVYGLDFLLIKKE